MNSCQAYNSAANNTYGSRQLYGTHLHSTMSGMHINSSFLWKKINIQFLRVYNKAFSCDRRLNLAMEMRLVRSLKQPRATHRWAPI